MWNVVDDDDWVKCCMMMKVDGTSDVSEYDVCWYQGRSQVAGGHGPPPIVEWVNIFMEKTGFIGTYGLLHSVK